MNKIYSTFFDDDFLTLQAEFENIEGVYIIEGYLGLWNGRHSIKPLEDSFIRLFNKAICNVDDFEVFYIEDTTRYELHDGCNVFYISPKKNKGAKK